MFVHVAYGRNSVHFRRRCDTLCKSGFVDDIMFFFGRLFDRVDLIKPVSNVRPSVRPPVRTCVRTFVRPQRVSSISMKFGMYVEVDELHDSIQYNPIKGQAQGHEPFKFRNLAIFKSYLLRHLQWELATDHIFLIYGTISNFYRAGFFIFNLIFVSRDFELGANVSCEESTVSAVRG